MWAGPQGRSPSSQTEVGLHPSGGVLAADPATRGQVCRLWAARRSRGLAGGSGSARLAEPDGCPIRRAGPPGRGRTGCRGSAPLSLLVGGLREFKILERGLGDTPKKVKTGWNIQS